MGLWGLCRSAPSLCSLVRAPTTLFPSKNANKASQLETVAVLKVEDEFMTQFGQDRADSEELICVSLKAKLVLWVPDAVKQLQVRLIVCAHMDSRGHRGQASMAQ